MKNDTKILQYDKEIYLIPPLISSQVYNEKYVFKKPTSFL